MITSKNDHIKKIGKKNQITIDHQSIPEGSYYTVEYIEYQFYFQIVIDLPRYVRTGVAIQYIVSEIVPCS